MVSFICDSLSLFLPSLRRLQRVVQLLAPYQMRRAGARQSPARVHLRFLRADAAPRRPSARDRGPSQPCAVVAAGAQVGSISMSVTFIPDEFFLYFPAITSTYSISRIPRWYFVLFGLRAEHEPYDDM